MVLRHAARAVLILVLIAAPWWFGGATLWGQFGLGSGVLLAMALWLASLIRPRDEHAAEHASDLPIVFVPVALMIAVAVVQLLPVPLRKGEFAHAELHSWLTGATQQAARVQALSWYPAATRWELMRLLGAVGVMLMAADLFRRRTSRMTLYAAVALNGAVLAVFGVVQKLSWEGAIFGTVPISAGQPFASYVNRNNAAGYLNLCVACGFALLIAAQYGKRRERGGRSEVGPQRAEGGGQRGEDGRRTSEIGARPPARHRLSGTLAHDRSLSSLAILALMIAIALGVVASASRGGIVSLAATALVAVLVFAAGRYRRVVVGGTVLTGVAAVGLLVWLGFGGAVGSRLATLRQLERLTDGRIQHWRDSLQAVSDFPWLGTGLGTYHYANRPYQSHLAPGWYYNADNEYLEWLVEGGAVSAVLIGAFLLLLVFTARRLLRERHSGARGVDAGAALMLVLVGQGLQALTDFGLTLTANLYLAAAVVGLAAGTDARRSAEATSPAVLRRPGRGARLLCGLAIAAVAGMGLWELWWTAEGKAFRRSIPRLERAAHPSVMESEVEIALARGRALVARQPENAELHRALADLWLERYRVYLLDHRWEELAGERERQQFWRATRPAALYVLLTEAGGRGEDASLEGLITGERAKDAAHCLNRCGDHLRRAQRACPLLPGVDFLRGCLSLRRNSTDDGEAHFRRDLFLSPSDPDRLHRVCLVARSSGRIDLAISCWRRLLQLDPGEMDPVLAEAVPRLGEAVVLREIVPADSPRALIAFAEKARGTRSEALAAAAGQLEGESDPTSLFLQGRVAELRGETSEAVRLYQQAIGALPLELEWRLQLADLLERSGRVAEAIEQVEFCVRIKPGDRAHQQKLARLLRRRDGR